MSDLNNPGSSSSSDQTVAGSDAFEPASEAAKSFIIVPASTSDLVIQLKTTKGNFIHYHVNRASLMLSSKVFEKMVDPVSRLPSLRKRKRADDCVVDYLDLAEDDPEALLLFLRVVHLQTELVPRALQFSQLCSLAIFCDKYNCAKVFGHWKECWLAQWKGLSLKTGYEGWVQICITFGEVFNFKMLSKLLIENLSHVRKNRMDRSGELISRNIIPERVLDPILREKRDCIENLYLRGKDLFEDIVKQLDVSTVRDEKSTERKYRCTDSCVGASYATLMRSLRDNGAWAYFKPDASDVGQMDLIYSPGKLYHVLDTAIKAALKAAQVQEHRCGWPCAHAVHLKYYGGQIHQVMKEITGLEPGDFIHPIPGEGAVWETIDLQEVPERNVKVEEASDHE